MKIIAEPMQGLKVIKPKIFEDKRGYFYESYNKKKLKKIGILENFVQDNQSLSSKGVLRGLHFQNPPYAQDKLVRVINGKILDVVVDIRKNSSSYKKIYTVELSAKNKLLFFIPKGFAHGFSTLENNTIFFYKCSEYYNKNAEENIIWNDPELNINWKTEKPIISEKDKNGKLIKNFISPF